MAGKAEELKVIYRENLDKDCELVITEKGWFIQFRARTWDEGEDMMYKVTSDKIPKFLSDLKGNLKLYMDMKEEGKPLSKDVEGLREMILRFKGDKPGIYLSDTYHIISCQEDYDRVEAMLKKAVDRANKVHETL